MILCKNIDNNKTLTSDFRVKLKSLIKENDIAGINAEINEQFFYFMVKINSLYLKYNEAEMKLPMFEKFTETLNLIHYDFLEIFPKKNYEFKEHSFESVETYLFVKLVSSVDSQILTNYPNYSGTKIESLTEYKKLAKIKGIGDEYSEDMVTVFEGEDRIEGEYKIEDSLSEDFEDSEDSLNEEDSQKKTKEIEQKDASISLLSMPPFTSHLVLFDVWILKMMTTFENPVIFSSATYNPRHISMLNSVFPDQLEYCEAASDLEKLDELIIITTNNDYFGKTNFISKNMWEAFGEKAFKYLTEPSLRLKKKKRK